MLFESSPYSIQDILGQACLLQRSEPSLHIRFQRPDRFRPYGTFHAWWCRHRWDSGRWDLRLGCTSTEQRAKGEKGYETAVSQHCGFFFQEICTTKTHPCTYSTP